MTAALLAFLHYLTLAAGLGAVIARGRRLRDLRRNPRDGGPLGPLLQADAVWGLAALFWIGTGLARAFGGVEKASAFYLRNGFFLIKMGLFGLVFLLELLPMITFARWRRARARGLDPLAGASLAPLVRLNDLETALVVAIAAVATLMARGLWLF